MRHFLLFVCGVIIVNGCTDVKFSLTKPHVAAVVLARGGSKGVRLKNIQQVGGKSLVARTLEVLSEEDFDSIWVSTDHFSILRKVEKFKVNIHWRSPETATDEATSILAANEFLKTHPEVDIICLFQCTSPFLKSIYIKQALQLLEHHDCVFSVTRSSKLLWHGGSGHLEAVNFNPFNRPRRQDQQQFVENGMFYFASRQMVVAGSFQNNRCGIVEIPLYFDMEIDTPTDFVVANMLEKLQL